MAGAGTARLNSQSRADRQEVGCSPGRIAEAHRIPVSGTTCECQECLVLACASHLPLRSAQEKPHAPGPCYCPREGWRPGPCGHWPVPQQGIVDRVTAPNFHPMETHLQLKIVLITRFGDMHNIFFSFCLKNMGLILKECTFV